ncbi:hypothetical protein DAPPUDRAFT_266215 [Daphnia pulex]|uniref:Uncharacterized protein n=1 Tax=Daphnia pulex TaxID=6669 RepID=E9HUN8_DAPPU|nr:hypothetical protein DAPPUDRAFT_266215 [Daphnia pulex]|eukprot:EFX64547.1 hypothetical protein DAPPUDRAFT_266215 [Daphnia pulex]
MESNVTVRLTNSPPSSPSASWSADLPPSLKLPRGKKKDEEQKAVLREKRRVVRRSRYHNPVALPYARAPPLAPARRSAIIRRPVVDRRIIVQPVSDRQAITDKAIKEAEEIAKTIRAGRYPNPTVPIIHNREALIKEAEEIMQQILAKRKSTDQQVSTAQHEGRQE